MSKNRLLSTKASLQSKAPPSATQSKVQPLNRLKYQYFNNNIIIIKLILLSIKNRSEREATKKKPLNADKFSAGKGRCLKEQNATCKSAEEKESFSFHATKVISSLIFLLHQCHHYQRINYHYQTIIYHIKGRRTNNVQHSNGINKCNVKAIHATSKGDRVKL